MKIDGAWNLEFESKPDFNKSMERIYAWYEGEIIDRPPVRFISHNQVIIDDRDKDSNIGKGKRWETYYDKWFDIEYRVESTIEDFKNKTFLGENFPIFWPDYSPHFLAGVFGLPLEYDERTAWAIGTVLDNYDNLEHDLVFHSDSVLYKTSQKLVDYALSKADGNFIVGYPDHNVLGDCLEALRGTTEFLVDLYDDPEGVLKAQEMITKEFHKSYDYFDNVLKKHKSLSCNWMSTPSYGRMYIPTADIATMFSEDMYEKFYLHQMDSVINTMDHTVYHMDGKGVAKHIDLILQHKNLTAIQWAQGVENDRPIIQWIPLIKKILNAKKSIICDVDLEDLDDFISAIDDPKGILLWVGSDSEEEQQQILKRVEKW